MTSDNALLERVRKLLVKAEADGVTPAEAEALTGKAAELMAKYGIDRALLAADQPATDQPGSHIIDVPAPWARVKAHLLCELAAAMRCEPILLPAGTGVRTHLFGYASDIERAEMLYTSVLVQMWHGLAAADVPEGCLNVRAWRRSWLLGYSTAVASRMRAAEHAALARAAGPAACTGSRTALVLADRALVISAHVQKAYPVTRTARVTYSGSGYGAGYTQGQRADIGTSRLPGSRKALRGQ